MLCLLGGCMALPHLMEFLTSGLAMGRGFVDREVAHVANVLGLGGLLPARLADELTGTAAADVTVFEH